MINTNANLTNREPVAPSASTGALATGAPQAPVVPPPQPALPDQSTTEHGSNNVSPPEVFPAAPHPRRKRLLILAGLVAMTATGYVIYPAVKMVLNTVSTDDAYVSGHVTFVAPRVSGQVMRVLVDDNVRVKKGDLLVQLDKEPYQVQVAIKQAAIDAAERDLVVAKAQVRSLVAQVRSSRFKLRHSMEEVRNQVELLKSNVAQLKVEEANRDLAEHDFGRGKQLVVKGAITQQEFDQYTATLEVARNRVNSANQTIQQTRAALGLPINYEKPLDVPENLDQDFSVVREALGEVYASATQLGFSPSTWDATPTQAIEEFLKQDPQHDLDRIYTRLMADAPSVRQAEARLQQFRRDLDQANLNLRYCDVVSEIDGVVTRRNVNPGNNVQSGQSLMAVRSLTEIWIDANFKETQLADLRIGQHVRVEVDMYGSRREFSGRITGFTMGTGQTLALLPPQNATGNFVKIVQRLPVRIELNDYEPGESALFVGLSCVPHVHIYDPLIGDDPGKGEFLQAYVIGNQRAVAAH